MSVPEKSVIVHSRDHENGVEQITVILLDRDLVAMDRKKLRLIREGLNALRWAFSLPPAPRGDS